MLLLWILLSLLTSLLISFILLPKTLRILAEQVGQKLRRSSRKRRELLFTRVANETRAHEARQRRQNREDADWEEIGTPIGSAENGGTAGGEWRGIIGFFHPFCNAGGGGERVLWAAIRATQKRWPEAICVVYTGDAEDKVTMLGRVKDRFNIQLHPPTIHFLYLTTRHWVLANTWPRFTLIGQSLGSLILAYDAFTLLVPDIFVDTMGYAFSLGLSSYLFPSVPTGAYVHYPTISTDMLDSLASGGQGVNAGAGAGYHGMAKKKYWELFANFYSRTGSMIDVVMTNSSWTQNHIKSLWEPYRVKRSKKESIEVVFPPVAVEEVTSVVEVSEASEKKRGPYLLYIAQFRPEKNHQLIIEAFASFLQSNMGADTRNGTAPKLVLIGSVRNSHDTKRVYNLRLLANELNIKDNVEFICDAPWPKLLEWMGKGSVGVNGMWNEHFGIGVVEYQAAGLISVVNDSGGPKLDIVVEIDGKPTGFHATTIEQYADGFRKALALSPQEMLAMRKRARKSAERFTDGQFDKKWIEHMEKLVKLEVERAH